MPPLHALVGSWSPDFLSLTLILVMGAGYRWMARRSGEPTPAQAWSFGVGLALWALATLSVVAVYAPVLFWMRALQVLLLLFVVPFLLAMGRPVATLRAASNASGRDRLDGLLASWPARLVCSPAVTSVLMLATPWLLYLTPWYVASLTNGVVAALTRILLLLIGFCYFYARLQSDPVPHRYSPLLSIGISVAETLGDGLLGLVLWLGPLIAHDYYVDLGRTWGPSMRTDQTVGAGILWILGDVLGLPFLLVLMRALGSHEKALADEADEADEADRTEYVEPGSARQTLWWEADPQLRDRFGGG
ncbi:MAG: cytochrome c oxidase assembly protein [Mycobacterium sp.]|nr:cytochrome c oxidase assembly protein [Mycobacterium sp.]